MNLRDLEYLAAMADYRHMGRAAEACHVSQPTMSMQLKKLEGWLGVPLFERRRKALHLTPYGEILAARAKRIVHEADALVSHAKSMRDPFAGEFKLGAFPTLAPYYLPRIVPALGKRFSKLTLYLVEDKTDRLLAQLKEGALDAALLALPVPAHGFTVIPLFEEPFLLAVPAEHRLATYKAVQAEDLKREVVLLLEDGHCMRSQALEVCSLIGLKEQAGFRATSLETLRQMVAAGVGVTLMPACAAIDTEHVVHIPFKGNPYTRTIGLVARETSPRQMLISAMAEVMR